MTFPELLATIDSITSPIKPMGFCWISKKIIDDSEPVGFMYRERGEEEEDSGWRFLSGTETEDFFDEETNTKLIAVDIVASYEPLIIPFLNSKVGSEFERSEDGKSFVKM